MLEKLTELQENDIIEKVEGPVTWVSPLVIVPKQDGNNRTILAMRVANRAIKRDRQPIPTSEEIVQEMTRACHFSKLNLCPGYHQLQLDAALQEITTF